MSHTLHDTGVVGGLFTVLQTVGISYEKLMASGDGQQLQGTESECRCPAPGVASQFTRARAHRARRAGGSPRTLVEERPEVFNRAGGDGAEDRALRPERGDAGEHVSDPSELRVTGPSERRVSEGLQVDGCRERADGGCVEAVVQRLNAAVTVREKQGQTIGEEDEGPSSLNGSLRSSLTRAETAQGTNAKRERAAETRVRA